jgi:hypothetical protein
VHRIRTEAPSRVQGTSSIIYGYELPDEQRESDSYGSDVCSPMFLCRQHDDRKHQLRRTESFDEKSLRQCCSSRKCCPNIKRTREYDFDNVRREAAAADLRDKKEEGSKGWRSRVRVSASVTCRQSDITRIKWERPTAGLNSPPLIRKNIHALTIRLNPKDKEIYSNVAGLSPVAAPVVELSAVCGAPMLATCVPPKAKKRNRVVPTNSPITATVSTILLVKFHNRKLLSGTYDFWIQYASTW